MRKTRLFFGLIVGSIAAIYIARGERVTAIIGTFTATFGVFSINEWGVVVGIISVPISLLLNFYFKRKDSIAFQKALEKGLSPSVAMRVKGMKL